MKMIEQKIFDETKDGHKTCFINSHFANTVNSFKSIHYAKTIEEPPIQIPKKEQNNFIFVPKCNPEQGYHKLKISD